MEFGVRYTKISTNENFPPYDNINIIADSCTAIVPDLDVQSMMNMILTMRAFMIIISAV